MESKNEVRMKEIKCELEWSGGVCSDKGIGPAAGRQKNYE